MKPKLIVIEGPDGIGKSTQAKLLAERYLATVIRQPSTDNLVSFLRDEAKQNPDHSAFERQLMIAISHTVDAFTKFTGDVSLVMDRSYISGLVYGHLTGVSKSQMKILHSTLSSVYTSNIKDTYDVTIVFLTGDTRLDTPDNDVFEQKIQWDDLRNTYQQNYKELRRGAPSVFSKSEKVTELKVTGLGIEQVTQRLVEEIGDGTEENTGSV